MNEMKSKISRFRELTSKASISPQEENEWGELCFILAPQLSNELENLGDKLTKLEIELDHTHQAVQAARNYIYSIDDDLAAPKELYKILERYAGDKEDQLHTCPSCDSFQVYIADRCNYVACRFCKMTGPNGKSEEEAIENWNNLPRRKSNDEEQMAEYEREMQVDCDNCGGSGILAEHHPLCSGDGEDCQVFNCPIEVQCGKCHATGKIDRDKIGATWLPIDNELSF